MKYPKSDSTTQALQGAIVAKTSSTEEFIEAIRRHIPDVVWRQIILDTAADIITDRELTIILSMNRKKVK